MKKKVWAIAMLTTTIFAAALLAGCGQDKDTQSSARENGAQENGAQESDARENGAQENSAQENGAQEKGTQGNGAQSANVAGSSEEPLDTLPNLAIRFGETKDRPVYEIQLEDNEVSLAFVRVLRARAQTIPIYVFDGSENTDVLQYYDIPASYNIPDGEPVTVESELAGEVYYSAPSRIMIFYKDSQIQGEYVKVGSVIHTEGLEEAVESNPLDSWKNKRVIVSIAE